MARFLLLLGLMLAASGAPRATAQAPALPADADTTRFSYHRSNDGFVRLDLHSGQVSQCRRGKSGWECLLLPDERAAYESEISRLQAENAALKKNLLDRGLALPKGSPAEPPVAQKPPHLNGPSDAEIDRAMSVMERIWRRLVEMIANLQRDLDKS